MIGVGTVTALQAVVRGVAPVGMDPRRFLAVPLFALVVFGVLYVAAVRARRRPQAHKRLVLLATLGLLPPALARFIIFSLGYGPPVVMTASLVFLVPIVAWDLRTSGRIHPATLWGGLVVVASVPARLLLASTDAWLAFASWAVALVR